MTRGVWGPTRSLTRLRLSGAAHIIVPAVRANYHNVVAVM